MKITNLEITFDIFDEDERIGYVMLSRHGHEFTISNPGTCISVEDLTKLNVFSNAAIDNYKRLINLHNEQNKAQNKDA